MLKTLKDLAGRAVKNLTGLQTETSELAGLNTHMSSHPTSGLTPQKLARVLSEAEQGNLIAQAEMAEDMEEKDGHVYAELQKRKRALLGVDWNIKPPADATDAELKDSEMIEQALTNVTWLDDAIIDMSDAILKGYSNLELEWGQVGDLKMPIAAHFRDAAWFQAHPQDRNQLMLRDSSYEGSELQPFSWISHTHKSKSGYVGRAGLVRVLAWPFLFKNLSARDLAEFLEIYGIPVRLGKYPRGANKEEKATLFKAVLGIGHNAAGILPQGSDIEFQEAAKGASDPFMAMINWCEKTQSKAILGGTLTSQADGKSSTNALGNVHNEVRKELRDSDLKQIAATLTRDLIYPIYALNAKSFTGTDRIPRFEFDISEPEDMALYAENLPKLVGMGMRIPVDYAHDKLHIPQAAKDEKVLMIGHQQPQTPLKTAALKSEPNKPEKDDKQLRLEQAEHQCQQAVNGWIDKIKGLVDEAESLEEVADKLLELMPDLSEEEFAEAMRDACLASQMAGRFDVQNGN